MTFEITRPSTLSPVQGADTWRLLPGAFTHPQPRGVGVVGRVLAIPSRAAARNHTQVSVRTDTSVSPG